MFKVRFHLGAGRFYNHWQIKFSKGFAESVRYVDPNSPFMQIVMTNCLLKNRKPTAESIFNGSNKTVCAWIQCESAKAECQPKVKLIEEIFYNPRIAPYWRNSNGDNIDGYNFDLLVTKNKSVYIGEYV